MYYFGCNVEPNFFKTDNCKLRSVEESCVRGSSGFHLPKEETRAAAGQSPSVRIVQSLVPFKWMAVVSKQRCMHLDGPLLSEMYACDLFVFFYEVFCLIVCKNEMIMTPIPSPLSPPPPPPRTRDRRGKFSDPERRPASAHHSKRPKSEVPC